MVRPMIEKIFEADFDDEFYERYATEVADLVIYGVFGKAAECGEA
jgi:hypothetical protein